MFKILKYKIVFNRNLSFQQSSRWSANITISSAPNYFLFLKAVVKHLLAIHVNDIVYFLGLI